MRSIVERELIAQLARLELEESELSTRRRKLHDRIAIFPSPALMEAERELSLQRREIHRQIDAARVELAALRQGAPAERG
jgi:hypothetical protein